MDEHARYGGSTADRTIECPPWRKMADELPPQTSSIHADRGTLLHKATERYYLADPEIHSKDLIGMKYGEHTLTEDLHDDKIVPAIAAVEAIFDLYNVETFECEAKIKLADNSWGTADLLARGEMVNKFVDTEGEEQEEIWTVALCLDYKFGDGIQVHVEGNRQELFYSAAAQVTPEMSAIFYEVDIVIMGIIQPADRGQGPDYTLQDLDPDDLTQFRSLFARSVEVAESGDGEFHAHGSRTERNEIALETDEIFGKYDGDHCQFCPGRGMCPATNGDIARMARLDVVNPEALENFPTYGELQGAKAIIKRVEEIIREQTEQGVQVKDFKLVASQGRRAYTDAEAAEEVAKRSKKMKFAESHASSLLSPAQMEKLCKKKKLDFDAMFGDLVEKKSSGTTLAHEDDKRPSVAGLAQLSALLDQK